VVVSSLTFSTKRTLISAETRLELLSSWQKPWRRWEKIFL
jgi:hypothetical protein